jgi:hypothetical protein
MALSSSETSVLTRAHSLTSQKTPFFIVTAVKTSNLTNLQCISPFLQYHIIKAYPHLPSIPPQTRRKICIIPNTTEKLYICKVGHNESIDGKCDILTYSLTYSCTSLFLVSLQRYTLLPTLDVDHGDHSSCYNVGNLGHIQDMNSP